MNIKNIDNMIKSIKDQNEQLLKIIKDGIIKDGIINNGLMYKINISNIMIQDSKLPYFEGLIRNLKNNIKKSNKKILISITANELNDIYIKQKGKCAITKMDLTFKRTNKRNKYDKTLVKTAKNMNDFNISISRIDNNEPYIYENIQLIGCRINLMKNKLSNEDFRQLCKCVVKNNNLYKKDL